MTSRKSGCSRRNAAKPSSSASSPLCGCSVETVSSSFSGARRSSKNAGSTPSGAWPRDDDMAARIAAHRARRPTAGPRSRPAESWPGRCRRPRRHGAGRCPRHLGRRPPRPHTRRRRSAHRPRRPPGATIVVSEEVGLGVHPSSEVGRRFRDVLGAVNTAVAAIADEVLLVVAGRVADPLHRPDARRPQLPHRLRPAPHAHPRALVWFGPVGAAIGAALGLVWWVAARCWSAAVAAGVVVAADLAAHRSAPHRRPRRCRRRPAPAPRPRRRLAVMATPEVGAFGVVARGDGAPAAVSRRWPPPTRRAVTRWPSSPASGAPPAADGGHDDRRALRPGDRLAPAVPGRLARRRRWRPPPLPALAARRAAVPASWPGRRPRRRDARDRALPSVGSVASPVTCSGAAGVVTETVGPGRRQCQVVTP